jgi:cell shape-determining protein MreC
MLKKENKHLKTILEEIEKLKKENAQLKQVQGQQ